MTDQFVIAHRGGPNLGEYRENTLEAFQESINIGVKVIEFDVRQTSDGKLVVFHNKAIGGLQIKLNSYQHIEKVANYRGYHIPLVEEVISSFKGQVIFDVEVKEVGYEKELIELLLNYLDYSDFFMKSFREKTVKLIKNIDCNIHVGLLIGGGYDSKFSFFKFLFDYFPHRKIKRTNPDFVGPQRLLSRESFINKIKKHYNLDVYVWTVNNPKEMRRILAAGAKAIITDNPDVALDILNNSEHR